MTEPLVASALSYYSRHGAALFPIPAGQKNPTGIVASFALDCSRDPAAWDVWSAANPGCNFGVVAGPSRWIIADVDIKDGRDAAWAAWCDLCATWGIAVAAPHVQSARGGWHVYFSVPASIDASTLRQPDAVKGIINVRAGNGFTVAAGSFYDGTARNEQSGPYQLLSDAAPYPAPDALVEHCTRRAVAPSPTRLAQGTRDRGDVAALLTWLVERQAFAAYEDWVGVGMALKLEFGDGGLELWQMTHNATVTADIEASKWASFATDPTAESQTINSLLARAHSLGWRGSVRKSTSSLFDGVAALAAASGAKLSTALPSGTPGPDGGMPMLAGQEVLTDLGRPILADFLAACVDSPARPIATDYPTLPESAAGHGLYAPLRDVIDRIIAMAESGSKMARAIDALAVLSLVHADAFDSVTRRIRALGCTLSERKIKLAAADLADKVERAFVTQDAWFYDAKGFPENDNSDNVLVFLGIIRADIRWNAWLERAEIKGPEWPEWTYIDDTIFAKLRTRANRKGTRFKPGKDFLWESLLTFAHARPFDPVRDMLESLSRSWDGTPRLATWLSRTCGVPCDPYHQSVARSIVGGMVRRARNPGCKHDTMPVLFGPQGTGKSTLAKIIALQDSWFADAILLGDASKELVLTLAGKLVVEISEMGMRGTTNAAHVKAMISRQVDQGRTAYARSVTERKRRNIFIGTTNDDKPLLDTSGNRRFLPVRVDREIDLAWLRANIEQIVGEAALKESAGDTFELPRSVWGDAAEHQEAARTESDLETLLTEWFAPTAHTANAFILCSDLVHLTDISGWRNGGATAQRGACMRGLGFGIENIMFTGKRVRVWVRGKDIRPADIPRMCTRYLVGADSSGRAQVTIRMAGAV